jgi:hypothetical protein
LPEVAEVVEPLVAVAVVVVSVTEQVWPLRLMLPTPLLLAMEAQVVLGQTEVLMAISHTFNQQHLRT